MAAIRSNRTPELNEFQLYAFKAKADEFNAMGHGSTILSININELHDLMMPDATIDQQMRLVEVARQSNKSKSKFLNARSELYESNKSIRIHKFDVII